MFKYNNNILHQQIYALLNNHHNNYKQLYKDILGKFLSSFAITFCKHHLLQKSPFAKLKLSNFLELMFIK